VTDPALVRDYLDGRLPPDRADEVAAELDRLPPAELERLLGASARTQLPAVAQDFTPAPRRLVAGRALGVGASGQVGEAEDALLRRVVALKSLRPRRPDEELPAFLARAEAFRREAAMTAGLEHPGVVPVHDIGTGSLGEPAFAMKRLEGEALGGLIAAGPLGAARAADIAIRVADAVGFAHERGIVHRDLKPEHVWIGRHGEVTVIDWGLAARRGEDARRAGTVGWMPPEQEAGAPADPHMDVWALGGLLVAMLPGGGPRGLAAIARRCRAPRPEDRYADGTAVAEDLRRWLADGISQAETPGVLARTMVQLRRNPGLAATAVLGLAAGILVVWLPMREAAQQREAALVAIREIAQSPMGDVQQIAALRHRLKPVLANHPGLTEARLAEARLDSAARLLEDASRQQLLAETLDALDRSWRVRGPWTAEVAQLETTLTAAGVWEMQPGGVCPAESHPESARLRRALVQLQRARMNAGQPADPRIPRVLAMCHDAAWSAVGRVIDGAVLETHDLYAPAGADLDAALASPVTADIVLATFGPDVRLVAAAQRRLDDDPGAFWPHVCLARDAVQRADWPVARMHGLVALGRESASLWPRLVLGYAALAEGDWAAVLVHATHAVAANPDHLEAGIMQAIALAHLGRADEAAERMRSMHADGHLRWHLAHRQGHPMEQLADAVLAAGLTISDAAPQLTPLVPVPVP
jgi:tRNA A-37 threonylcarbamoyl transferase component Bud32